MNIPYSTKEHKVGTWINGKPIYRKTIEIGALPNSNFIDFPHKINKIDTIIKLEGFCINFNKAFLPLPYPNLSNTASGAGNAIVLNATTSTIFVKTESDRSSWNGYVTIFYTKTTD